jgi:hypothetical protein
MAESLAHKFGQIIGNLLELAIQPHLEKFAKKNKLLLDKAGNRKTRPGKKKVTWTDNKGNKHNLDFVLERGGTESHIGTPVAFIESAWRRYTKHSRNKAQEIQGAIIPLFEKYKNTSPFIGVVLAGVFTEDALNQLKSLGFGVLYFHYNTVIKAFRKYGIDAAFNEKTSEQEFKKKIGSWQKLSEKSGVAKELLRLNKTEVDAFFDQFTKTIERFIVQVIILPLFGQESIANSVIEAINIIKKYEEKKREFPFLKYEIIVKYNNGDRIEAIFKNKNDAITFLEKYL